MKKKDKTAVSRIFFLENIIIALTGAIFYMIIRLYTFEKAFLLLIKYALFYLTIFSFIIYFSDRECLKINTKIYFIFTALISFLMCYVNIYYYCVLLMLHLFAVIEKRIYSKIIIFNVIILNVILFAVYILSKIKIVNPVNLFGFVVIVFCVNLILMTLYYKKFIKLIPKTYLPDWMNDSLADKIVLILLGVLIGLSITYLGVNITPSYDKRTHFHLLIAWWIIGYGFLENIRFYTTIYKHIKLKKNKTL